MKHAARLFNWAYIAAFGLKPYRDFSFIWINHSALIVTVIKYQLMFFWFVHSEQATALSNPSQMELYEPRASQTRRYPPSVSSSPQKDIQSKVRVSLNSQSGVVYQ